LLKKPTPTNDIVSQSAATTIKTTAATAPTSTQQQSNSWPALPSSHTLLTTTGGVPMELQELVQSLVTATFAQTSQQLTSAQNFISLNVADLQTGYNNLVAGQKKQSLSLSALQNNLQSMNTELMKQKEEAHATILTLKSTLNDVHEQTTKTNARMDQLFAKLSGHSSNSSLPNGGGSNNG